MQILVNSDNHVENSAELTRRVEDAVTAALGRFADQITRVEVHLNDENAEKGGDDDKRCLMEARLAGLKPIAVTAHAGTLDEAVDGAVEKLERALESTLGRLGNKKGRTSYGGDQTI